MSEMVCYECDGNGVIEDYYEASVECPYCEGTGEICSECDCASWCCTCEEDEG